MTDKPPLLERLRRYRGGDTEYRKLMDESIGEITTQTDEITRLQAEVEELTKARDEYAGLYADRCGSLLAAEALNRELVELISYAPEPYEYMKKPEFVALPVTMRGFIDAHRSWIGRARALIEGKGK